MTPCEPMVNSVRAVVPVGEVRTLAPAAPRTLAPAARSVRHGDYALEAAKRRPAWSVVSRGSDGGGPMRTLGRRA